MIRRTTISWAPLFLTIHVGQEDAAPVGAWINDGAAANDAAGVEDGVATDFRAIAKERAEFAQAGVEGFAVKFNEDGSGECLEIGEDDARKDVDWPSHRG